MISDGLMSRSQFRNRAGERARVRFTCDMLQRPADGGDWRCRVCTDTDDWDELTQTTWSIADVSVGDRLLLMRPASRAWPADDEYGRFATVIAVEPASADAASREAALAAADASLRRMPVQTRAARRQHAAKMLKDKIVVRIEARAEGDGIHMRTFEEVHLEALIGIGQENVWRVVPRACLLYTSPSPRD